MSIGKRGCIEMDLVPCADSDVVLPCHDVEIITDLDIIELCTLNYDLPHFPLLTGKLYIVYNAFSESRNKTLRTT